MVLCLKKIKRKLIFEAKKRKLLFRFNSVSFWNSQKTENKSTHVFFCFLFEPRKDAKTRKQSRIPRRDMKSQERFMIYESFKATIAVLFNKIVG